MDGRTRRRRGRPWIPPLLALAAVLVAVAAAGPRPVTAAYQGTADSNESAFEPPCIGWDDPHPERMLTLATAGMKALGYDVKAYKGATFTRAHVLSRTIGDWAYYVHSHGDYYWNGGVTMPRSAQQGAAVINLYAPQYAPAGGALAAFDYLPYTHAYFPTERFDEVRQVGSWTFGKRGDGYVALWSWRPTQWRTHDPAQTFTNGLTKPFDLVAPGGANNVWISQVGDASRWKTFDAFVTAMSSSPVSVADLGESAGVSKGFDVTFHSPTEGSMHLGWTGPFTVDGNDVALHRTNRFANRFGTTPFGNQNIKVDDATAHLQLDLLTSQQVAGQE